MKKHLKTILVILISVFIIFTFVYAANTYPTTLNDWEDGDIIESDWADAIENKLGIDSSAVTTSIDYLIKNSDSKLGSIASLADPNADRIMFWDDSEGTYKYLIAGSG